MNNTWKILANLIWNEDEGNSKNLFTIFIDTFWQTLKKMEDIREEVSNLLKIVIRFRIMDKIKWFHSFIYSTSRSIGKKNTYFKKMKGKSPDKQRKKTLNIPPQSKLSK